MSNFGFGFHGRNNDDDDDHNANDRGKNNGPGGDPFGFIFGGPGGPMGGGSMSGGNLGDILNQFGSMLSGFGADLSSEQSSGPVNYSVAERIARQHIARTRPPAAKDSQAVAESVRLVELWLDEATVLPAGATGSVAFGPEQWLDETFDTWKRVITPLADKLGDAALIGVPEEMREQLGPMAGMLKQINGMNFGMQLGSTLGQLAKTVVTSTQWGVPLAHGSTAAIATYHLEDMAAKLGCERQEALIYLAAREAAHHRLFNHVSWLRERLILDIEEFAAGLTLDTSEMEQATRDFTPEAMNDPEKMQEMMNSLQGQDLSPKVVSSNDHARERLETSLSLVEGWVDFVVGNALADRFPQVAMIGAAWSSFRTNESPVMDSLTQAVGISFRAPRADKAAELWRKLHDAVGAERRDAVWDHPDFLPVTSDLDNPAAFIGHVTLDSDELKDFNPISEIEKLEEQLRREAEANGDGNSSDSDGEGGDNPGSDNPGSDKSGGDNA